MSMYDAYEPTQEDIEVKEMGGSNHHHRVKQVKKPKPRGYFFNDAMSKALDKVSDTMMSQ